MSVATVPAAEEDMKAVTDAFLAGRPIPADVAKRVDERAEEFRNRIARDNLLNVSVPYTRKSRESGH